MHNGKAHAMHSYLNNITMLFRFKESETVTPAIHLCDKIQNVVIKTKWESSDVPTIIPVRKRK